METNTEQVFFGGGKMKTKGGEGEKKDRTPFGK